MQWQFTLRRGAQAQWLCFLQRRNVLLHPVFTVYASSRRYHSDDEWYVWDLNTSRDEVLGVGVESHARP